MGSWGRLALALPRKNGPLPYPIEIHEYLSTFENSIGAVDDMLKTMMSVSRNELLQKLDPLEQAKVDLVSAYTLNSMFWVYLVTQGINPKEDPVNQELERIRVYMNRVKEITDKKKAGKLDKGTASRFVKNALWEPKPKNASKVANKQKIYRLLTRPMFLYKSILQVPFYKQIGKLILMSSLNIYL
ncbi:nuclear nucleic acid-binding protein C1D-like [Sorex fumeus]|uniref:nuclear nucleic acid-binding protein C1D-like n=1 Tax=Sorex fumeus TaxID=62283 RepID=UPI0024AE4780|nr:nuclear nucleic acid-binding protein C1D-like [Sorex fumeus]